MLAISRRLDLPSQILTGDPVVELKGRSEAFVQCHRGITGFSDACVCIATSVGTVRVCGSGLRVLRMNRDCIVVCGRIDAVHYGEDGS